MQHENFCVVCMLLVATIQGELVVFPYKISGNCFKNVEAQKWVVALNINFNNIAGKPGRMPSYQYLVTSCQCHVLYWWIAPEVDSLCMKVFQLPKKCSKMLMNTQRCCVPQQQLCLSTNVTREPWGSVEGRERQFYVMQEEWKPLGEAARCSLGVPSFPSVLYPRENDRSMYCATCFLNQYFFLKNVLGWKSSAQYCWSNSSP